MAINSMDEGGVNTGIKQYFIRWKKIVCIADTQHSNGRPAFFCNTKSPFVERPDFAIPAAGAFRKINRLPPPAR